MAKIIGRERLLRKLQAMPAIARSRVKQAIAESADEIVAMQKRFVPADSGALRNSIQQHWGAKPDIKVSGALIGGGGTKGDPDLTVWITAGSREAYYARWVEFGTGPHKNGGEFAGTMNPGTPARPFFFPPFRALRRRAIGRISRAVRRAAKDTASS